MEYRASQHVDGKGGLTVSLRFVFLAFLSHRLVLCFATALCQLLYTGDRGWLPSPQLPFLGPWIPLSLKPLAQVAWGDIEGWRHGLGAVVPGYTTVVGVISRAFPDLGLLPSLWVVTQISMLSGLWLSHWLTTRLFSDQSAGRMVWLMLLMPAGLGTMAAGALPFIFVFMVLLACAGVLGDEKPSDSQRPVPLSPWITGPALVLAQPFVGVASVGALLVSHKLEPRRTPAPASSEPFEFYAEASTIAFGLVGLTAYAIWRPGLGLVPGPFAADPFRAVFILAAAGLCVMGLELLRRSGQGPLALLGATYWAASTAVFGLNGLEVGAGTCFPAFLGLALSFSEVGTSRLLGVAAMIQAAGVIMVGSGFWVL